MKKPLLVLMTALLLFTAVCSGSGTGLIPQGYPTDNAYHPETDWPYPTTTRAMDFTFTQVENGYYFLNHAMLFYVDEKTMDPIPVCAKPECPHGEATTVKDMTQCNAFFFNAQGSNVFYYDGQLYIFHRYYGTNNATGLAYMNNYLLTRVSTDGTRRQTILNLEYEWPVYAIIHRGFFYLVTQDVNENGKSFTQLWAYSLHEPKKEPQLLYQSEERDFAHNIVDAMFAYGNYLYISEYLTAVHTDDIRSLRILDLTTNEWTIPDAPEGYMLNYAAISDGRLVRAYRPFGVTTLADIAEEKPDLSAPMLVSNLDGSNAEQIAFDSWGKLTADETYIYLGDPKFSLKNADGSATPLKTSRSLRFYDVQMKLVDEMPLECLGSEGYDAVLTVFPTRGEKILLWVWQDNISIYYINRSEIGTGNITPKVIQSHQWGKYGLAGKE